MRIPKVIAHRGYQRQFPENTMSAIRGAVECGAMFFEIDIHLSADRVPVLSHDDNLWRMCGIGYAVHETTIGELQQYAASESSRLGERFLAEPVATLAQVGEFLALHPQVTAFVELKASAARHFGPQIVVGQVLDALPDVLDQCVFISFDTDLLREVQRQSQSAIGPVISNWDKRSALESFHRPPRVLFCDLKGLPASGDLSLANAELAVYEVADAETACGLADRGVDYVETFAVCEMLRQLDSISKQER